MILKKTNVSGRVEAVLINRDPELDLCSERVAQVVANFSGFVGDAHAGATRASCSRVLAQYRQGTEIRNTRQVSLLCVAEMEEIASAMGIPQLLPEWVGANLSIAGIPNFTQLPPSSRLIFSSGVSLVVDMENGPCKFPGEIIERHHPGRGARFSQCRAEPARYYRLGRA